VTIHEGSTIPRGVLNFALKTKLLPEAYIYGIDYVLGRDDRGGYLHGKYEPEGFRSYFLWSFLYKTPIPAIPLHIVGATALLLAALLRGVLKRDPLLRGLAVLAGIYVVILITTRLNIGYRHAFPLLYLSCIFSAFPFCWLVRKQKWIWVNLMLVALAGHIAVAATSRERYISFINHIGGGQDRGYLKLTDSSVDWGQDLPAVARYIDTNREIDPETRFFLCLTGTGLLERYGIQQTEFLPFWGFNQRKRFLPEFAAGTYIFSATALTLLYEPWELQQERYFRQLDTATSGLYERLKSNGSYSVESAFRILSAEEIAVLDKFEFVRCRRLAYYLRHRPPETVLNGAMLVYTISEEELSQLKW
jgi:hypothetical protein